MTPKSNTQAHSFCYHRGNCKENSLYQIRAAEEQDFLIMSKLFLYCAPAATAMLLGIWPLRSEMEKAYKCINTKNTSTTQLSNARLALHVFDAQDFKIKWALLFEWRKKSRKICCILQQLKSALFCKSLCHKSPSNPNLFNHKNRTKDWSGAKNLQDLKDVAQSPFSEIAPANSIGSKQFSAAVNR